MADLNNLTNSMSPEESRVANLDTFHVAASDTARRLSSAVVTNRPYVFDGELGYRFAREEKDLAYRERDAVAAELEHIRQAEKITDVPLGARRTWLLEHGHFAKKELVDDPWIVRPGTCALLKAELAHIDKITAGRVEETPAERSARKERIERFSELKDNFSAWQLDTMIAGHFGGDRFRENHANIQGTALWFRQSKTGGIQITALAFADNQSIRELAITTRRRGEGRSVPNVASESHYARHVADGWRRLCVLPNLGARRQAVLDDLRLCARHGDELPEAAPAKAQFVAARLELARLKRLSRALKEDAGISSACEPKYTAHVAKCRELEDQICAMHDSLSELGIEAARVR